MERTARLRRLSAAGLIALYLAGCGSTSAGKTAVQYPVLETDIFTLVLLRTGYSPPTLTEEEKRDLSRSHSAFMGEQAEAGHLLVAGPFGNDKAHADLSGLFILDIDDPVRGLAIAQGDPKTQAGEFRQEAFQLATLDVLRRLPALEQERQEQRERAGEDLSQPDIRAYVILMADEGEHAMAVLAHPALAPAVVLFGRLGAPRDGALFCVLAIEDAKRARALLAIANEPGIAFEVSEWYASPSVALLAELVRPTAPE